MGMLQLKVKCNILAWTTAVFLFSTVSVLEILQSFLKCDKTDFWLYKISYWICPKYVRATTSLLLTCVLSETENKDLYSTKERIFK